ncbi:MAG: hypothetical protein CL933_13580 [Deltaproteobacteria bacterium]|jgi:hypothetical protein|nr:hypothetical protein [Deltaproteobacteria bacterium]
MSRRTKARALVVAGLALLLWGVLGFTSASIGGPPEGFSFANRRSYSEVKRATHSAFLPFVVRISAGLLILFLGTKLADDTGDKPES